MLFDKINNEEIFFMEIGKSNLVQSVLKQQGRYALLAEIERLSPGYIQENFITPIVNGDDEVLAAFLVILRDAYESKSESVAQHLCEILEARPEEDIYKKIKVGEYKGLMNHFLTNETVHNLIKKWENIVEVDTLNGQYEYIIKMIEKGAGVEAVKKFEKIWEDNGTNILYAFGFSDIEFLKNQARIVYKSNDNDEFYNLLTLEKAKVIREKRDISTVRVNSALRFDVNSWPERMVIDSHFDILKGKKISLETFKDLIFVLMATKETSALKKILKNHKDVLSGDDLITTMYENIISIEEFQKFKDIIYKASPNYYKENLLQLTNPEDPHSLSKGATILMGLHKSMSRMNFSTKEKMKEVRRQLYQEFGSPIFDDFIKRECYKSPLFKKIYKQKDESFVSFVGNVFAKSFVKEKVMQHFNISEQKYFEMMTDIYVQHAYTREDFHKFRKNKSEFAYCSYVFGSPLDGMMELLKNKTPEQEAYFVNKLLGSKLVSDKNLAVVALACGLIDSSYEDKIKQMITINGRLGDEDLKYPSLRRMDIINEHAQNQKNGDLYLGVILNGASLDMLPAEMEKVKIYFTEKVMLNDVKLMDYQKPKVKKF